MLCVQNQMRNSILNKNMELTNQFVFPPVGLLKHKKNEFCLGSVSSLRSCSFFKPRSTNAAMTVVERQLPQIVDFR